MYKKIGVLGGKHSILPFQALGIDVFPIKSIDQAREQIEAMAGDYGIIFITERLAEQIADTIETYAHAQTPAIIPIPSSTGNLGIGMQQLNENVEKAIGMNIFEERDSN